MRQQDHGPGDIPDVDVAFDAPGIEKASARAESDQQRAAAGPVPFADDDGRVDDDCFQSLCDAAPHDVLRIDLADRVGRLSDRTVERARLGDGFSLVSGFSQRSNRTAMHEQSDSAFETTVDYVGRDFRIRRDDVVRPFRIERDLSRAVEQVLRASDGLPQRVRIVQRGLPELDPVVTVGHAHASQRSFQQIRLAGVADDQADRATLAEQLGRQMASHESRASRDRYRFIFQTVQCVRF